MNVFAQVQDSRRKWQWLRLAAGEQTTHSTATTSPPPVSSQKRSRAARRRRAGVATSHSWEGRCPDEAYDGRKRARQDRAPRAHTSLCRDVWWCCPPTCLIAFARPLHSRPLATASPPHQKKISCCSARSRRLVCPPGALIGLPPRAHFGGETSQPRGDGRRRTRTMAVVATRRARRRRVVGLSPCPSARNALASSSLAASGGVSLARRRVLRGGRARPHLLARGRAI